MPASSRKIRGRIRSVANTRKITKAMELVAAAKMRRSVQQTLAGRPYTTSISEMVERVRRLIGSNPHPLLTGHGRTHHGENVSKKPTLLIIAASDRGLCGGFNSQLLKTTLEFLRQRHTALQIMTVGRRAEAAVKRAGYEIVASFEAISNSPSFVRARPIGEMAYRLYMEAQIDCVYVAYMDFRSAMMQVPTVKQLLPITPEAEIVQMNLLGDADGQMMKMEDEMGMGMVFEPNPERVLDRLLPRLIEAQMYQSLLESSASEHSSRMMAMRNATENASSMLEELTFTYNQARQAGITREISEISAGKAALE